MYSALRPSNSCRTVLQLHKALKETQHTHKHTQSRWIITNRNDMWVSSHIKEEGPGSTHMPSTLFIQTGTRQQQNNWRRHAALLWLDNSSFATETSNEKPKKKAINGFHTFMFHCTNEIRCILCVAHKTFHVCKCSTSNAPADLHWQHASHFLSMLAGSTD